MLKATSTVSTLFFVAAGGVLGCVGGDPEDAGNEQDSGVATDAGTGDAGTLDGGIDAGPNDAGRADGGNRDAGADDAGQGPTDSGTRDGGATDGGATGDDAGAPDGGGQDGGPSDGGLQDGGPNDGGVQDGGPLEDMRDVIVGSGANHTLYLSIDEGITWCRVHRSDDPAATGFDNPFLFRNITYANGRFIAGSWRTIMHSTNGFEWTALAQADNPAHRQWIAQIDQGNGYWVATGGYGTAMRSTDLTTWQDMSGELPGNEASRTLAFGNGVFVTGRDGVGWWESTDGTGWTQRNATGQPKVVFGDGTFYPHPGFDQDRGIRLRAGFPDKIQRALASEESQFTTVATVPDSMTRFAFGEAPAADFSPGRVPAELATCLGL